MAKKDRTGNRKKRDQRKQFKVPELGYYLIVTDTEATECCFFKGLTYDRVLIYPTGTMRSWMKDHSKTLQPKTKSQFYVAITRARYSVGIVFDYDEKISIEGVEKYQ